MLSEGVCVEAEKPPLDFRLPGNVEELASRERRATLRKRIDVHVLDFAKPVVKIMANKLSKKYAPQVYQSRGGGSLKIQRLTKLRNVRLARHRKFILSRN